jgi:hypothetical protein
MITIILAVASGLIVGFASAGATGTGWAITLGVVVAFLVMGLVSRYFAKQLNVIGEEVTARIEQAQGEAMRMANRFQTKPVGSQKTMQRQLEKKMEEGILDALKILERAEPMYKWNVVAERQIATLEMQLNYQIKRFDEVDRLLDKVMLMDPTVVAMKLARQYHNDDADMEKTFRKGVKRFKYEKGVIVYAVYSWVLVKRKQLDKALEVLDEAKQKTEDETLARNWQFIANNRPGQFSNAGLGDAWYGLHLEPPPKPKASKGQAKGHPMMPKGRRRR